MLVLAIHDIIEIVQLSIVTAGLCLLSNVILRTADAVHLLRPKVEILLRMMMYP